MLLPEPDGPVTTVNRPSLSRAEKPAKTCVVRRPEPNSFVDLPELGSSCSVAGQAPRPSGGSGGALGNCFVAG